MGIDHEHETMDKTIQTDTNAFAFHAIRPILRVLDYSIYLLKQNHQYPLSNKELPKLRSSHHSIFDLSYRSNVR